MDSNHAGRSFFIFSPISFFSGNVLITFFLKSYLFTRCLLPDLSSIHFISTKRFTLYFLYWRWSLLTVNLFYKLIQSRPSHAIKNSIWEKVHGGIFVYFPSGLSPILLHNIGSCVHCLNTSLSVCFSKKHVLDVLCSTYSSLDHVKLLFFQHRITFYFIDNP